MSEQFPATVIIVGAGVFGLSTALAISRRHPDTKVTVIDRHTPPVPDGTSVDTSRILRPDYVDKEYERLAVKAQSIIKNDPELKPYYFENGFTFCVDGEPGALSSLWNNMLHNLKTEHPETAYDQCDTPDDIYRHLHGMNARSAPSANFPGPRRWVKGFTSKRCATVNAEAMIKVYYRRCAAQPNIDFKIGMPVNYLLYSKDKSSVEGVVLENGRKIKAERVIVSAGPWSSRLVNLNHEMHANAVQIVYFKLTQEEYEQYKDMACHTNINTGMNIFTPIGGLLKVLRRQTALRNTTILKDPEDPTKFYKASYPLTKLDDPLQTLPSAMEQSIRDELREIFPAVADRPFFNTRFCWQEQTTNGDFLICPHPRFANLQMATGGSLHAWKFLPILGEFVVDSMEGKLSETMRHKWSWESKSEKKPNELCFMEDVALQEFQQVTGSRARL